MSRAATRLGLTRNTLRYRLEKHRLTPPKTPGRSRIRRDGGHVAEPLPPPRSRCRRSTAPRLPPVVRWERRPVTLLSAVLAAPDPAASLAEQSRALGLLVDKVESFGGRLAALGHTALHASFGLEPTVAGEDAPSRAAHAAMAMQRAVEAARASAPQRPALRVVLHTGPVLVARVGDTAAIEREAEREAWACWRRWPRRRRRGPSWRPTGPRPFSSAASSWCGSSPRAPGIAWPARSARAWASRGGWRSTWGGSRSWRCSRAAGRRAGRTRAGGRDRRGGRGREVAAGPRVPPGRQAARRAAGPHPVRRVQPGRRAGADARPGAGVRPHPERRSLRDGAGEARADAGDGRAAAGPPAGAPGGAGTPGERGRRSPRRGAGSRSTPSPPWGWPARPIARS